MALFTERQGAAHCTISHWYSLGLDKMADYCSCYTGVGSAQGCSPRGAEGFAGPG